MQLKNFDRAYAGCGIVAIMMDMNNSAVTNTTEFNVLESLFHHGGGIQRNDGR